MTTQVGRKCLSSFVSDLLYTTNKTLFSFLLIFKPRSNTNTYWGPDRKTNFDHAGHFSLSWLTWKWNAGNLETTSWSFQWANFGRAAWFSRGSSCSNSCNCCCSSCCSTAGSCFGTWKSQIKYEPGLDFWKVSFDRLRILWFWMFNPRELNPLTLSSRLGPTLTTLELLQPQP